MNSPLIDEIRLKQLIESALHAWNQKDAAAFSQHFVEDAEFTDVIGQLMKGRSEIERLHRVPFTTVMKSAQLTTKSMAFKPIRPDVAAVDIWWETTGHTSPRGEALPLRAGLLNLVAVREADWAIAVAHNADYTATYNRADVNQLQSAQDLKTKGK